MIGSRLARLRICSFMDASRQTYDLNASRMKAQYEHDTSMANADVLAEVASGTGGTFFQNNNDLEAGFCLEGVDERAPDAEFARHFPRAEKYLDWPMLVLLRLRA